jgi:hypothetical protein
MEVFKICYSIFKNYNINFALKFLSPVFNKQIRN